MKISRLVIMLVLLFGFCCCKKINNSTPPVYSITGVASYTDYVSGKTILLDSQAIYIKHYSDSADTFYIYAVQTDMNGNFIFYNLPDTSEYIIYTKPTEKSLPSGFTGMYFGKYTYTLFPQNSIQLLATDTIRENGIQVTTVDVFGDTIPGVTVTFYLSMAVAQVDSFCTGAGSIASVTTNAKGIGVVSKLFPGTIYINAALKVDSGYTFKHIADSTIVGKYGITGAKSPFNLVLDVLK